MKNQAILAGAVCLLTTLSGCQQAPEFEATFEQAEHADQKQLSATSLGLQPIYGGTADNTLTSVVEIRHDDYERGTYRDTYFCSGVMITEDVILTAAHCVCHSVSAANCDFEDDTVYTKFHLADGRIRTVTADHVVVHPQFYDAAGRIDYDLALVQLDFSKSVFSSWEDIASVIPSQVATRDPAEGDSVTIVGFGPTNENCTSGRGSRHKATVTVQDVTPTHIEVSAPRAGTCAGDSGGAMLNARGELVAVNSYTYEGSDPKRSFFTRLSHSRHHSFVDDACAMEAPTDSPNLINFWQRCNSNLCPCTTGQGDCDYDRDCEGNLECKHDVGARYGYPARADVCERPHPGYCTCGDVGFANLCMADQGWNGCSDGYVPSCEPWRGECGGCTCQWRG